MINQERLLEEFLELVQIDSETKHEAAIAKVIKEKLHAMGFTVEEDEAAAKTGHEANNLIATLPGTATGPTILFSSHMDTVVPGNGVKPTIRDGYVYSDGTTILGADDKAGIAAIFEAIRTLKEKNLPHPTIQVVITVGEESGLVGSRAMDSSLLKAEMGFIMDSDGKVGEIIAAGAGQYRIVTKIYGKAAHAGVNPEDGISAINVASKAISRMPLGRIDEDTTANIGRFEGGKAYNIVSDYAEVWSEARSLVMEKLEAQVKKMTEAFESAAAEMGARCENEVMFMYHGFKFDENTPVVAKAIAAVKRIGREPKLGSSGGGSDGNVFNGFGIPTVNFGIGYEQIHTTNERMPLEELYKASELVLALVEESLA
ncbi:M20/M25/M40 family metallo-hydrolase [Brevibacillus humidisoli]|uniref:M20/M25/M40 family metallo-hydrolase n=1 Tax=Brevibacillus humidisoli TaxID=2895522 RepID=UPI001E404DDB|nr:M20/M25/M40 family metallo-hydrolase [Brevibacillus humidisoli]UFJ42878.1 M20/M25/M40 family metallo-hydrolase [Brevibacillus humidisoli]